MEPRNYTIQKKEYPFVTAYYAVLREDEPEDSNASKLLDWILSEQGQKVCEVSGYVPIQ